MSRNIVVCCDGTANEFARDHTNVLKLYAALRVRALASLLELYGLLRPGNDALVPYAIRMMRAVRKVRTSRSSATPSRLTTSAPSSGATAGRAEYVPKRHYDEKTRHVERQANRYRRRTIPSGAVIHWSVDERGGRYADRLKLPSDVVRLPKKEMRSGR
jgi:uncharacterized protein (DUF2235 family)